MVSNGQSGFLDRAPKVSWLVAAILWAISSWILGLATTLGSIESCTWVQRYAWLLSLLMMATAAGIVLALHALPTFNKLRALQRARSTALIFILPWLFGTFVSGPNLFGTIERSRQKRTIHNMWLVAHAIDEYRTKTGHYPLADDILEVVAIVRNGEHLPDTDGWGNPLLFAGDEREYFLISYTECGQPETAGVSDYEPGETTLQGADIVMTNGRMFRYPEGVVVSRQPPNPGVPGDHDPRERGSRPLNTDR